LEKKGRCEHPAGLGAGCGRRLDRRWSLYHPVGGRRIGPEAGGGPGRVSTVPRQAAPPVAQTEASGIAYNFYIN